MNEPSVVWFVEQKMNGCLNWWPITERVHANRIVCERMVEDKFRDDQSGKYRYRAAKYQRVDE